MSLAVDSVYNYYPTMDLNLLFGVLSSVGKSIQILQTQPTRITNFWIKYYLLYIHTRSSIISTVYTGHIYTLTGLDWPRGGARNLFWGGQTKVPNRKLWAKPESRARSARVSRAKPRVEGAKRPRIEGEARTEGEARKKAGEGSGEGARWAPPQKIFEKSNLKPFILVHIWSNYLTWLTKWFNCPHSWKIISIYLMWRNYWIMLEYKTW